MCFYTPLVVYIYKCRKSKCIAAVSYNIASYIIYYVLYIIYYIIHYIIYYIISQKDKSFQLDIFPGKTPILVDKNVLRSKNKRKKENTLLASFHHILKVLSF